MALHSRLLYDFTEATVVPVIDNLDPVFIDGVWAQAQGLLASEGLGPAGEYLRGELPAGKGHIENKFLREFLSRALEMGVETRVKPYPLSKKDILMYLLVELIVPGASSWAKVVERHQAESAGKQTRESDWKRWATAVYGARFDDDTIRRAAAAVDEVPFDIQGLGLLLTELA
jgi:hypothetical protein